MERIGVVTVASASRKETIVLGMLDAVSSRFSSGLDLAQRVVGKEIYVGWPLPVQVPCVEKGR